MCVVPLVAEQLHTYVYTSKCTCPVVQGVGRIAKCMMSPKLVNA